MGKPIGTYLTLEAPGMASPDEDYHREISEKLAEYLKELMGGQKNPSVLVVGLGNRDVTPDALGPKMVSNLLITRHLIREYGREVMGVGDCCEISGSGTRSHGTDRYGNVGDHQRRGAGDISGSADRDRCAGSQKHSQGFAGRSS